ncbi:Oidioi.mRNA.OKI2018_I69.chr2.g4473.t1.cds [Oikopleura dioica]|uniref:Oidioi.mRNA.OKI2018_I69.chr2.g4473.t1.cds n=1 Tax=Oikopleura dioica TaxID=34765 RepID=A0ABN7T6J4_OIKDI|nr:Oidioi.mRNA.OKI2018_I69.chr2.g4473.t1.cds [Oikopleura dioica]
MKLGILLASASNGQRLMGGFEDDFAEKVAWDIESEESRHWCDQQGIDIDGKNKFNLDSLKFRHQLESNDMERSFTHFTTTVQKDRIIGGENAQKNAWKWIGYFYGCGSTLIANDWALTAAHCCTIPAWYFKGKQLCFGRDERGVPAPNEQCAEIVDLIQHPLYDRSETVLNDICLIRLGSKIKYTETVEPSCLPRMGASLSEKDTKDVECFVAGWGYRQEGVGSSLPSILQDTDANILSNSTCDKAYTQVDENGRIINYYRRDEMSCFGHTDGTRDACQGDSGGPLVCLEDSENIPGRKNPVLRGVVSWGEGCARFEKPGVYARLSNYIDWIHETIIEKAQSPSPICLLPENVFDINTKNALIDCAWDKCTVHCKNPDWTPSLKTLTCNTLTKKYTEAKITTLIDCAPDPGPGNKLFSACGALTSHFDVDLENLDVKCNAKVCKIYAKNKKLFSPSVNVIKCQRGRYVFKGDSVKAHPAGTTTKACGAFFDRFPEVANSGIKVSCKPNACFLSADGVFQIQPSNKVMCKKREWVINNKVIGSSKIEFSSQTFDEFDDEPRSFKAGVENGICGRTSVWDYVLQKTRKDLRAQGAKAVCSPSSMPSKWTCQIYCPPKNGASAKKTGVLLSCKKNSWLPGNLPSAKFQC